MNTLVLSSAIADQLLEAADRKLESAAVLLARLARLPNGDLRILARRLDWVQDDAYTRRTAHELVITSDGYMPSLRAAEERQDLAIFVHTHPSGKALPSEKDKQVDERLRNVFRNRTGSDCYGSLIAAVQDGNLIVGGAIEHGETCSVIERSWVVGDRLRLLPAPGQKVESIPAHFDRNVRAFGGAVQRALGDLHIGIVGCGGIGSAVAEQLARLGVRNFTLVDPDKISEPNVTRVYGSTFADVGKNKVDVLGGHLERIAPGAVTHRVATTLINEVSAKKLASCDIIFGCTDDNAARLILARMSTYMLVPVIDSGVVLSSDKQDRLIGIDGRVTIMVPGTACLLCRSRIDVKKAQAELMTPQERKRLADEGYAPALEGIEPAVVAFTTAVSAAAVGELLERLVHYGIEPVPSEILLRLHDREASYNRTSLNPRHFCAPDSGKLGVGINEHFLDFPWPS